jgi:phospholipid-binding lipoprotein MlaA
VTRFPKTTRACSRVVLAFMLGCLLSLGGCATLKDARGGPGARLDPWETWNRKVFAFNENLDQYFLKPVATGYSKVVPQLVRQGVDNFFRNAADAWSAVNDVLQGKGQPAFDNVVRFTTNSTFGIFGIFDIATEMGVERHNEDFGQTLGRWGFGPGAYVVWPLFGPSTVRDSIALPLDRVASPAFLINDGASQFAITVLQIVNTRANLLGASQVLDDIALDKYTFLRDAYLQRRRSLIYDGDAPPLPNAPSSNTDDDDDYAPMTNYSSMPAAAAAAAAASTPAAAASAAAPPTPAASGSGSQ